MLLIKSINKSNEIIPTHFGFYLIPVAHEAQTKHDVNNINDVNVAPFTIDLSRVLHFELLKKVNGSEHKTHRVDGNHHRLPECFEKWERMNRRTMMFDVKLLVINYAPVALEVEPCQLRCWINARPSEHTIDRLVDGQSALVAKFVEVLALRHCSTVHV